ncbi:unnamed protein product, partial [Rotaria sp. Silwood2]
VQCNEADSSISSDSSISMNKETLSQQDLPIDDNTTNNNDCHEKDLFNALLNKEPDDINQLLGTTCTNDNNINSNDLLNAYPNENQSDSNFSSNDLMSDNDLFDALLSEKQSDQNSSVNNDSPEPIEIGDSMPLQNNSSYSIQNSNTFQNPTQLNEQTIVEPNCLHFSLDVKSEQKDIYKSDQFSQKEETKPNGYITRIQGIKTPEQKMRSIWPMVR